MDLPLISVIIPVFGSTKHLPRVFHSLNIQTYPNIEIIVVDDGSDTAVSCQPLAVSHKLMQIRQEHQGAAAARNTGFKASHGEYVIFWDADVIGEPGMFMGLFQALQSRPDASYAYSSFWFGQRRMPSHMFDGDALKKKNFISTMSLIRRQDFPGFDESLKRFQDWDLWLTLLSREKKGVFVPEYLFRAMPKKEGISFWLPTFAYKKPWRFLPGIRQRVRAYENARDIIRQKHSL